jgi:arabinose-5-phosphate isomerase
LGDALAMALLETKGFSADDFKRLHPGGNLGRKLLTVAELMHAGDEVPKVTPATPMPQAIYEMSNKRLGITAVVDDSGKLVGCLTDGDLRRLLTESIQLLERPTGECMHPRPHTIGPGELASAALHSMEEKRITSLFVCDDEGLLQGVVHLHDLWQLELF